MNDMTLKTIALAATAATVLASAASADAFGYNVGIDSQSVELGQVTSGANGVVSLYEFHAGEQGPLLGTETVAAGANYDVRVTLDRPAIHDVLAVLTVDGQIVATQELENVR
jgi:hypothetical protein